MRIAAILAGALLLYLIFRFVTRRLIRAAGRKVSDSDLVTREQEMRARTVAGMIRGLILVLMIAIVVLMILQELGYNIGPLIAGAGIAGLALGLGAQTLVKDLIGGFFIIFEGQFLVGDVIQVGTVKGKVEAIKLRTTAVRDGEGILNIIPNGEMRVVSNLTKGWSRVNIDVDIDHSQNVEKVEAVLREAAARTARLPEVQSFIIEGPDLLGVEGLEDGKMRIRLVARTEPFKDPDVARALRRQVAIALQQNGIALSATPETRDVL